MRAVAGEHIIDLRVAGELKPVVYLVLEIVLRELAEPLEHEEAA